MKNQSILENLKSIVPIWQDLAGDFLELKHTLSEEQRNFILKKLQQEKVREEVVLVHEGFSVDGYLILICPKRKLKQIWVYDPENSKMARLSIAA